MTDPTPTPTRAEVEALSIAGYRHGYPRSYGTCWEYLDPSRKDLSELEWEPLVVKSQADATITALRERAEAAQKNYLDTRMEVALLEEAHSTVSGALATALDQLTAARRALRRAAPTEGEA